eukprot:15216350-Ditylum_brightwellii.AAC.2
MESDGGDDGINNFPGCYLEDIEGGDGERSNFLVYHPKDKFKVKGDRGDDGTCRFPVCHPDDSFKIKG